MAGLCAWRGPRQSFLWNSPPVSEDELTGATSGATTNNSGTPSYTPAMSRVPTPAPALLLATAKLVAKYTNADLEQATKLALKSFVQGQQLAQS